MTVSKAKSIIDDYAFHNLLIHNFVDGLTHEESLLQLPFEHNCMNWILGHIVTNRSHTLETVGAGHTWGEQARLLYHTGTPPVTPGSLSLRFEKLIQYLDESVALLTSALEVMGEAQFDELHSNYRGEKPRYTHLTSFHWHEAFHVGQLEILKAFILSKR
jgi:hypothetical protein